MPGKFVLPREELQRLYYGKLLSAADIAGQLGCSETAVYNNFRRYNLPRRKATEHPHGNPGRKVATFAREELQHLYCDEKLTLTRIAELCGASNQTISRRFEEYGLPKRSIAEESALSHQRYPNNYSHSPETREKSRQIQKKLWANPEHIIACLLRKNLKPNKTERKLQALLDGKFPGEWEYVGDGQVVINGCCPDFINCNGKKLIIELFGERWHTKEKIPWHQTELGRIMVYAPFGFKTLVIWSKELRKPEQVMGKVNHFMGGK